MHGRGRGGGWIKKNDKTLLGWNLRDASRTA